MRARHSHQTILCRGKWHVIRVEKRAIPVVKKAVPDIDIPISVDKAAANSAPVALAPMQPETLRLIGGALADEVAYLLRNQPLRMPGALWRPDA